MLQRSPPPARAVLSVRLPLAAAALMGAAGVALGAVAAHLPGTTNLALGSSFLLFHAPAVLALASFVSHSRLFRIAQMGLIVGPGLFSGTLALHALAGIQVNPGLAPLGGIIMILAWLLAAVAFLTNATRN